MKVSVGVGRIGKFFGRVDGIGKTFCLHRQDW